jgi:hypothetical protein
MQPCAVCGAVTLNAAGYCTQCGTFRGVPQQGAYGSAPQQYPGGGQPTYQSPVSAPGYGQPTTGGGGYPTSGPPGGYPTSGGPGYTPTSGGYPSAYPPPPGAGGGGGRKPFVVPLVALSVTLVVLVVAIVIVVLVRNSGDSGGGGTANPTTPAPGVTTEAPAGNVDPCVVGLWRVDSHEEVVPLENVGKATFTGGEGAELELKADGSGAYNYGDLTTYEATIQGKTIRLEVTGTLNFEFTARDDTFSYKNFDSDATARVLRDGQQVGSEDTFEGDDDPAKYECSGDSLVQNTNVYETRLSKIS